MFSHTLRPGVELRYVEMRHAPVIWDRVEHDRTHLREWLSWVDNSNSIADIETWIDSQLKMFAAGEGCGIGIWVDGQFAGVVGTHAIHKLYQRVEIGYWLGREFVGRGIMSDCVRLLTTHAFAEWKLHRVEIVCAVGNERSAAIPKRLGFLEEGVMRESHLVNGQFLDARLFSMLVQDWKPR